MRPRKILLVEDNEENRYLLTFLLEQHGYEVVIALDGGQGVEAAREQHPDIILLDIQLPILSGYEVAQVLRAAGVGTPIIAVTSYAMREDRARALAAGCSGYIEKPIDPDTFVAEMEMLAAIMPSDPSCGSRVPG